MLFFTMNFLLIFVFIANVASKPQVLVSTVDGNTTYDIGDAKLDVPSLLEKYGYPVETHFVVTKDNYILTLHRIPHGKKCGPESGKRVLLLMHGLTCDSSIWIITQPERGLAYNLADECYDVWMGNFRGNTYSKNHTTLSPTKNKIEFWAFSWNEMGIYDLPAFVDYILEKTGAESLYYIGYSMGTTSFLVFLSEKPEYNSKIKVASLLAPVAYTENARSPLALLSAPLMVNFDWIISLLGGDELAPNTKLMEMIGLTACHQNSPIKELCTNFLFLAAGFDSEQLERDLLPIIMGHIPAGSSVRSAVHYAQGVYSKQFQKYDFRLGNMQKYGSLTPPQYNLEKITAPVALFWGENDLLAEKRDVAHLAKRLSNLKLNYRIKLDKYNHVDFFYAKDNIELLNKPLIEFMKDN